MDQVPGDDIRYLSSARAAGERAAQAGARSLLLTHLRPGTEPAASIGAARAGFGGDVGVASGGMVVEVG